MTAETTTSDVLHGVDLSGKTVVVTGASAGLGVETARALSSVGAHVVMAVRDLDKGKRAADGIRDAVPSASLELAELDLASLDSVRAFTDHVLADHDRIDLLINNAGVMAPPLSYTKDGFELQIGTNHLGHFVLTNRLLPAIIAAAPARIVNLSSRGHVRSDIHWDDPHFRSHEYEKWSGYGQSKTANILFTVELDRRLAPLGVRVFAVHPGVILTELSRHLSEADFGDLSRRSAPGALTLKPVEAGAATSVWAATSAELDGLGGIYCEDCQVAGPVVGEPPISGYRAYAVDPEAARRLWAWSEEQVGEEFPPP
jgi:NAD(P)-dependent dehydrogenase (short-subunit alcohol dehydrogenase family)